jgi:hypothetical protein
MFIAYFAIPANRKAINKPTMNKLAMTPQAIIDPCLSFASFAPIS